MSIETLKCKVLEYAQLVLGTLLYCAAWECFLIPNNYSSGGITGVCTLIQYATDGAVPVSISYMAFNVVLLLAAFLIMGGGFGFKTIFCIALSTVLFQLLPSLEFIHCIPGQFLYVQEKILIPVIAGLLEGVGLGIIFLAGGSTGGSDIIVLVINKFWPISPGRIFLVTDFVVISAIAFLPDKAFSDMIYGYVMMGVSAFMIDYVLLGNKTSVQILVFSEEYEAIADHIINDMERGVTALNGKGWFTKQEKTVLLVLVRKSEMHDVTRAIKSIDPRAFVSVSPATGVFGEGFEEIKTGIHRKKKK